MGQRLYFCTFTHTSPPGYNSRDGMQAARKAGSGLGAALCRQQALQGSRLEASELWPRGREGPSVRLARCVPLAQGLRPGQGPHGLVARRPPRLALGGGTRGSTYSSRPHSCCSVVRPAHQPLPPSRQ